VPLYQSQRSQSRLLFKRFNVPANYEIHFRLPNNKLRMHSTGADVAKW